MPPFTTNPISAPAKVEGALSARERAIAKLTEGQGNQSQSPVKNPTQVAPEELGAISQGTNQEKQQTADSTPEPSKQAATPAQEPGKEPLSAQYAQLARKEKAIRAQAQKVRAEQAAIKAREDAIKAKEAEMLGQYIPKSRLSEDPLSVLSENGVSYDVLTQKILNAPSPEQQELNRTISVLKQEIQSLRDEQTKNQKQYQDKQTQDYQQAIKQIKTEVVELVKTNDTYEMVNSTNSVDDVVELIEKTFQKEGIVLSVDEATQAVEDYLTEEAIRLAGLKKIQSRMKPATPPPAQQASPTDGKQPHQTKTLTNAATSTGKLSSRERAMLAFHNKLNKE